MIVERNFSTINYYNEFSKISKFSCSKMHYNFLFNGCSITYGGELQGHDNDLEHQRTHRFSHLVGDHYNKTYTNISQRGASNDWIVEKTVKWFEEGNTCDVAVIQFTDRARTIWYNDADKTEHQFRPNSTHKIPNSYMYRYINRSYYKLFYSDILGIQIYYKNLFFITNYLKNKNIKYILLAMNSINNVDKCGWVKYCKEKKILYIREFLGVDNNNKKIVNKNYCPDFYQHNRQDLKYIRFQGSHPSELGHQKIANYIIMEIKNAL